MPIKIACLQTRLWPDFESATEEALQLARQVDPDTRMLFLPEYCGGLRSRDGRFDPPLEDPDSHPVLNALREHAASSGTWIVAGSMAVHAQKAGRAALRTDEIKTDDARFNNRGFIIDDSGAIRSSYNKIHLFDIQLNDDQVYRESDVVAPGGELSLTSTPLGLIGHTICYDLRFPHLYRELAQAGAQILAIPAAFTKATGEVHWHALCRARAIENGAYVVAPCATGLIDGGGEAYGHSLVVDPWGEIIAEGSSEPGVITAVVDIEKVKQARDKIPSLCHDRAWQAVDSAAAVVTPPVADV